MIQLYLYEKPDDKKHMTVRDNRGQIVYLVEGTWGRKDDILVISSLDGQAILSTKQIKLSPLPIFDLIKDGEKVGSVRKHPGLFGIIDAFFTIQPYDWTVTGNFENLNFTIHREKDIIMKCQKVVFKGSDIIYLQIFDEENIPLCALVAVLLDHYIRKHGDESSRNPYLDDDYDLGLLNNFDLLYKYEKQAKIKN